MAEKDLSWQEKRGGRGKKITAEGLFLPQKDLENNKLVYNFSTSLLRARKPRLGDLFRLLQLWDSFTSMRFYTIPGPTTIKSVGNSC